MLNDFEPFNYFLPTQISFGVGLSSQLGSDCKEAGYKSALVIVDPGVRASGAVDPVFSSLGESGIQITEWTSVEPNPTDVQVETAATTFRESSPDAIIGIGGGSALDTAKGVSILATNPGRLGEFAGNGLVSNRAHPTILVPTTAGTGSEVTANVSVTQEATTDKIAVRDRNAYATQAILDPGLLAGLPSEPAAAAGIDALTHAIESYTSTRSNEMTRLLALEAVRRIGDDLETFVEDRRNPKAAASMLYASCLAGIAISHTGTGNAHAISRALGGKYGVSHGVGCGMALPAVMEFNAEQDPYPYSQLAKALGVDEPHEHAALNAELAIRRVDELRDRIGIPEHLGVTSSASEIEELCDQVVAKSGPNPRETTTADAKHLLAKVL